MSKDVNAHTITSLKLKLFYFFIYCCQHHERKTLVLKYFCYQTDSDQVLNTSIFSAVFLASPYYNYLSSTASTTMIYWRYSNSVNTGSSLPNISDVMTRKRRNVIGIDMIRNNRITSHLWYLRRWYLKLQPIRKHNWSSIHVECWM